MVDQPPPLTAADLRPGRLMDHEIISQWGSLGAAVLLLPGLAAVAGYRFRSGTVVRRLGGRMGQYEIIEQTRKELREVLDGRSE